MSTNVLLIQQPVTGKEDLGDLTQPKQALAQFYQAINGHQHHSHGAELGQLGRGRDEQPPRWDQARLGGDPSGLPASLRDARDILLRVLGLHAAPRRRCLLGRRARARSAHHEPNDARPCASHEPAVPPRRCVLAPAPSPGSIDDPDMLARYQAAVGRTAS